MKLRISEDSELEGDELGGCTQYENLGKFQNIPLKSYSFQKETGKLWRFAEQNGLFPFRTIGDVLEENQQLKEEVQWLNDVITSNISQLSNRIDENVNQISDNSNQITNVRTELTDDIEAVLSEINDITSKMNLAPVGM